MPGSANDLANLEGSQLVHKYGYQACVPSDGLVASGGTDLFLAGVKRWVKGGQVGVHSWQFTAEDGTTRVGTDFPREHTEHKRYLAYYDAICIPRQFYWKTLTYGGARLFRANVPC